jgi:Cytochrome bd-type quinol oxidase, subunit 1
MLKLLVVVGVVAVFLLELGWATAEIGRQPWIVYNVLRVSQAANTSPSIIPLAVFFVAFYLLVLPFTVLVIKRLLKDRPVSKEQV